MASSSSGANQNPSTVSDLPEMINVARCGFAKEARQRWYPLMPKIVTDGPEILEVSYADHMHGCEKRFKNDVKAYELERKIRGVPIDFRSKLVKGKLDRPGVEKVYDIISVLSFRYRISSEDVYLLEPLVYHVAAVVRRIDACYSLCSDMMRKSEWYIAPTMLEHRVKIFSFQDLVEVVMPVTYQHLMAIKALNDEFLNHIFVGLFFSILPKPYAYRILDSFLIEGGKILYRYGIALLAHFKKQIKAGMFKSGEQFWAHVQAACHADRFNFEDLHGAAFDKNKKFMLRMMSRSSKINRRNINALKNQIREPLEKSLLLTKGSAGTHKLASDVSAMAAVATWFDRRLWSQSRILDTAMAIKLQLYLAEAMHPFGAPPDSAGAGAANMSLSGIDSRATPPPEHVGSSSASHGHSNSHSHSHSHSHQSSSSSSSHNLSATDGSSRLSVTDLQLVFSSTTHGRSLAALYAAVDGRQPCVLLLRSLNKKAVIGVYVSCAIAPSHRSGIYDQRGDSSCFCFRLNSLVLNTGGNQTSINTVSFFKSAYVRKHIAQAVAQSTGLEAATSPAPPPAEGAEGGKEEGGKEEAAAAAASSSTKKPPPEPHHVRPEPFDETREQYTIARYVDYVKTRYINADASVLMFGATACRQPMNAIRVDRDLRLCYTAPSETFGNPNLAPEESSPFPIDVVEVFAGKTLDPDVDMALVAQMRALAQAQHAHAKGTDDGKDAAGLDRESSVAATTAAPTTSSEAAAVAAASSASGPSQLPPASTVVQMEESYCYGLGGPRPVPLVATDKAAGAASGAGDDQSARFVPAPGGWRDEESDDALMSESFGGSFYMGASAGAAFTRLHNASDPQGNDDITGTGGTGGGSQYLKLTFANLGNLPIGDDEDPEECLQLLLALQMQEQLALENQERGLQQQQPPAPAPVLGLGNAFTSPAAAQRATPLPPPRNPAAAAAGAGAAKQPPGGGAPLTPSSRPAQPQQPLAPISSAAVASRAMAAAAARGIPPDSLKADAYGPPAAAAGEKAPPLPPPTPVPHHTTAASSLHKAVAAVAEKDRQEAAAAAASGGGASHSKSGSKSARSHEDAAGKAAGSSSGGAGKPLLPPASSTLPATNGGEGQGQGQDRRTEEDDDHDHYAAAGYPAADPRQQVFAQLNPAHTSAAAAAIAIAGGGTTHKVMPPLPPPAVPPPRALLEGSPHAHASLLSASGKTPPARSPKHLGPADVMQRLRERDSLGHGHGLGQGQGATRSPAAGSPAASRLAQGSPRQRPGSGSFRATKPFK